MKEYNITAQVYDLDDQCKQTLLINDVVKASCKTTAISEFYSQNPEYKIVKIYSAEEL